MMVHKLSVCHWWLWFGYDGLQVVLSATGNRDRGESEKSGGVKCGKIPDLTNPARERKFENKRRKLGEIERDRVFNKFGQREKTKDGHWFRFQGIYIWYIHESIHLTPSYCIPHSVNTWWDAELVFRFQGLPVKDKYICIFIDMQKGEKWFFFGVSKKHFFGKSQTRAQETAFIHMHSTCKNDERVLF